MTGPRDLAPTPRVSQPQEIAGNRRRHLRKVSYLLLDIGDITNGIEPLSTAARDGWGRHLTFGYPAVKVMVGNLAGFSHLGLAEQLVPLAENFKQLRHILFRIIGPAPRYAVRGVWKHSSLAPHL